MDKLLCVVLSLLFIQAATANTFSAVVLEARYDNSKNASDNWARYQKIIDSQKKGPVDFIVLPEYALTGIQTDNLDKYAVTFTNSTNNLTLIDTINKYAKALNAYIVVNLLEKEDDKYYSTSIVVNGTENLIAKYRKINRNDTEQHLESGSDFSTFTTVYGKVGLLSGDDILYENPTQNILKDGATTIIYTTAFRSIAPFKTAISLQQGYAQANGVNLLVANLDGPDNGIGGSGIYAANQVLNSYVAADPDSQLLQASVPALDKPTTCLVPSKITQFTRVPKVLKSIKKPISAFKLQYNSGDLTTKVLDDSLTNEKLCDGDFCCLFTVNGTVKDNNANEKYRIVVRGGGQKVCAVLLCDKDGNTCGTLQTNDIKTEFSAINITASKDDRSFRPYTLVDTLKSIDAPERNTYFCQNDTGVELNTVATNTNLKKIVVFGISSTDSGASSLQVIVGVNFIALIVALKYLF